MDVMKKGFLASRGRGGGPGPNGSDRKTYREAFSPLPLRSEFEILERLGHISETRAPEESNITSTDLPGPSEVRNAHEVGNEGPDNSSQEEPQGEIDGTYALEFEAEEYEKVVEQFTACSLLLYFLGKSPSEAEFRQWMTSTWHPLGWKMERI